MATMKTVLDQLTGNGIVEALAETMAEHFPDFAQARNRYQEALGLLQQELGDEASPSVNEEMEAVQRQTASTVFYSVFLGLKANLDNFINPLSRNFLDTDPEIYLRENTARRLPEYVRAQEVRCRFFARLTPAQRELHEDITAYVSYWETTGPKLAHYYGYLLGNEILYRLVPGYHSDQVLTEKYRRMLEDFFGREFA